LKVYKSKIYRILPDLLRINSVRGRHTGTIDCAAITEVDVKLASIRLTVKDVPAHPFVEPPVVLKRKCVIQMTIGKIMGDKSRQYTCRNWKRDFARVHWRKRCRWIETNVNMKNLKLIVTLTPWVNYTFRVIAENSHGRSDRNIALDDEGTEPDNLVVYWKPMEKYYWNAPHLQYLKNHTIIREQPTFRPFQVQVRAVNAIGPSILEPDIVKGFSGEDVPSTPPNNFRVAKIMNFSTVSFKWEPVEEPSVNGFFRGYEIEFWRDLLPARKYRVMLQPNETEKTITTLAPNSNYTAVIRTKNRRYGSEPSPAVHVTTPEGLPSRSAQLTVMRR
ncbi:fibronectin type III domain protein, partial [Cooperia oncophora]